MNRLEKRKAEFGVEHQANIMQLHKMINDSGQQLMMDEFSNPVPIIISYNSETNEVKFSPRQYIVRGIMDALTYSKNKDIVEIIFVRHGETDWNVEGRLQGGANADLNENGIRETVELAEHLKKIDCDFIVSSPVERCSRTSQEISEKTSKEIIFDPSLKARGHGEHEGKTLQELGMPFENYEDMIRHFFECNCPGGESIPEFVDRIRNFFNGFHRKYGGKRVVLSTSGGFIMSALCYIFGKEANVENSPKHNYGYVSYLKIDKNLNVIDSLVNKHASDLVEYLSRNKLTQNINF